MSSGVPLIDLQAQHRQVAEQVGAGFARVLETCSFILGPEVPAFEQAFAAHAGVRHCIGVANGTDALELSLRAAGIGPGDEVLLPVNTFIATALAVARIGAVPAFVDCEPVHFLMDAVKAQALITKRTRGLLPVHLFGQIAEMERFEAIARRHNLRLFEDAAQAHGALRHGFGIGHWGIAAGTSFYPGKNLGAYGDAGAVLTNSDDVADRLRALRNYGSAIKYHHPETGFNSRLDTLQAVVLLAKLTHLEQWNEARRQAAARYDMLLADVPEVIRPMVAAGNLHVYHLYVIRTPHRDRILAELHNAGIGAAIHYPLPIHLQGAFKYLGHREGDYPVAERAAKEVLSLPMFPHISPEQQQHIVSALKAALRAAASPCIAV